MLSREAMELSGPGSSGLDRLTESQSFGSLTSRKDNQLDARLAALSSTDEPIDEASDVRSLYDAMNDTDS